VLPVSMGKGIGDAIHFGLVWVPIIAAATFFGLGFLVGRC
jgi:hypothetical protein